MNIEKIVREYIDKTIHMSLATVSSDRPWVCEVHFVYDENLNLYFRSLKSRRHSQEIASNPNVAGNIVKQHAKGEAGSGIYFEGEAALMENRSEKQNILPILQERLGTDESALAESEKEDGHKFYRITVQNWYVFGKFTSEEAQKYRLEWNGGVGVK